MPLSSTFHGFHDRRTDPRNPGPSATFRTGVHLPRAAQPQLPAVLFWTGRLADRELADDDGDELAGLPPGAKLRRLRPRGGARARALRGADSTVPLRADCRRARGSLGPTQSARRGTGAGDASKRGAG